MLATWFARFAQLEEDPRGAVGVIVRHIGGSDQAKQPLVLHRSIGEQVPYPLMEPAPRYVEKAAHHGRITLSAMGFDERVFQSDRLRFPSIPHWSSPCSHNHPTVSTKAWEVHPPLNQVTPMAC